MDTILADMATPELNVAITIHSDIEHIVVLCPFCRNTHKHATISKDEQEVVAGCQKGHYMLKKKGLDGKSIDYALRRREQTNVYKRKVRSEAKKSKAGSSASVSSGSE